MNFGNAVMLGAAVLGLIDLAKTGVWGTNKQRITLSIVLGASFGAVFLMRYTAWAHEQVIGDKPLDELGIASLVLVSFFMAGSASAGWKVLGAVTSIGQNQPEQSNLQHYRKVEPQDAFH